MPWNRFPRRLLYSELSCGRRSVGGQKKRFKDHIKSSLSNGVSLSTDVRNWPGTKKNGVLFATKGCQHLNSNILMRQKQSVCADTNSATHHPNNNAAGIRLYNMWPCLRLSLRTKEPHTPTQGNALSSVIVDPTDN